jgi:hypothetical protein
VALTTLRGASERPWPWLLVVGAVVSLVVLGTLTARSRSGHRAPELQPPSGAWFGAWVGSRGGTDVSDQKAAVLAVERQIGRKLAISQTYVNWGSPLPAWRPAWDLANGRIPLISFGNRGDTRDVAAGRHDGYLRALAKQVRALGRPVFLRYGWEPDGPNNTWWVHSGADYVAAWRHVREIFEGVPAAWVWSPNAGAFQNGAAEATQYWPGADQVDWIGADGYNWYGCRGSTWRSLSTIFHDFYAWGAAKGRPLMIAETGSTDDPADPGRKAAWLEDATRTMATAMPRVKAFVYFDSAKECTWWADSSPRSGAAFARMAHDPHLAPEPSIRLTGPGT